MTTRPTAPAIHPTLRAVSLLLAANALLGVVVLPIASTAFANRWVLITASLSLAASAVLAVGLWRIRPWSFPACVAWILAGLIYLPTFDYFENDGPNWYAIVFLVAFALFGAFLAKYVRKISRGA
jgi:hypothetical protein